MVLSNVVSMSGLIVYRFSSHSELSAGYDFESNLKTGHSNC
jgi:hypothetical protein